MTESGCFPTLLSRRARHVHESERGSRHIEPVVTVFADVSEGTATAADTAAAFSCRCAASGVAAGLLDRSDLDELRVRRSSCAHERSLSFQRGA